MKIDIRLLKKIRGTTEASISDCRSAIIEAKGDYNKALDILREKGLDKAAKKTQRKVKSGLVMVYAHQEGRIGAMVLLRCETDFVARSELFKQLAHNLVLHITAMDPKDLDNLLNQPFVRDESRTVKEIIQEHIGKLGENIMVEKFTRFEV